uniref:EF-hand domain-containing protein n=1 Tax=Rhizophagus irregularis (strain DAOM 181602 / DAOM 197198 / MUCL 43194) TaxID=747089 RepID=U9UMC9_RHIID
MATNKISDQQLQAFFSRIDVDNSGTLTPLELQRVLLNGDWSPFNLDTIELLFSLFDHDRNGTINFNEFIGLWRYIEEWKRLFTTFDKDNSGAIEIPELVNAMTSFGFNISEQMLKKFVRKYKITYNVGNESVSFDNFVQLCVTVKTSADIFRAFDQAGTGWVKMNYEQFMEVILKN